MNVLFTIENTIWQIKINNPVYNISSLFIQCLSETGSRTKQGQLSSLALRRYLQYRWLIRFVIINNYVTKPVLILKLQWYRLSIQINYNVHKYNYIILTELNEHIYPIHTQTLSKYNNIFSTNRSFKIIKYREPKHT